MYRKHDDRTPWRCAFEAVWSAPSARGLGVNAKQPHFQTKLRKGVGAVSPVTYITLEVRWERERESAIHWPIENESLPSSENPGFQDEKERHTFFLLPLLFFPWHWATSQLVKSNRRERAQHTPREGSASLYPMRRRTRKPKGDLLLVRMRKGDITVKRRRDDFRTFSK